MKGSPGSQSSQSFSGALSSEESLGRRDGLSGRTLGILRRLAASTLCRAAEGVSGRCTRGVLPLRVVVASSTVLGYE